MVIKLLRRQRGLPPMSSPYTPAMIRLPDGPRFSNLLAPRCKTESPHPYLGVLEVSPAPVYLYSGFAPLFPLFPLFPLLPTALPFSSKIVLKILSNLGNITSLFW